MPSSQRRSIPRRLAGRARGALGGAAREGAQPAFIEPPLPHGELLQSVHGERLASIERACENGGPECFRLFRELDTDTWALLLTQEYEAYPHIRALLPAAPPPALQAHYNGRSGVSLALQSKDFYERVRTRFGQHSDRALAGAGVLDFGCGWGRLTRYFARDVDPGGLFGCDPVQRILDECVRAGVPATFARSKPVPDRIPFEEQFDLAFSFSVFTHLSESVHLACLRALHGALRPGGILVATIRPPEYQPYLRPSGSEPRDPARPGVSRDQPGYLFAPHSADPSHDQYQGGEMTYGEAVVTLPYVQERWAPMFELLETDLLLSDPYQVVLTLRRR